MNTLESKVAIITGGTSGIGARTARAFVDEGARVVIAGRRQDAGERFVTQVGHGVSFVRTEHRRTPRRLDLPRLRGREGGDPAHDAMRGHRAR